MMSCEEFTDQVTAYLEGNVPYGQRIGMWLHTVMCKHCRNYLEQMAQVARLAGELGDEASDEPSRPENCDELMEAFRARTETDRADD